LGGATDVQHNDHQSVGAGRGQSTATLVFGSSIRSNDVRRSNSKPRSVFSDDGDAPLLEDFVLTDVAVGTHVQQVAVGLGLPQVVRFMRPFGALRWRSFPRLQQAAVSSASPAQVLHTHWDAVGPNVALVAYASTFPDALYVSAEDTVRGTSGAPPVVVAEVTPSTGSLALRCVAQGTLYPRCTVLLFLLSLSTLP
jgi:hypothetical protein